MTSELLTTFQSFRTLLCVCPFCGELKRVSDLHLRYGGEAPKTWLDEFESKNLTLAKEEERFEEKEQRMREEAIERGRKKVSVIIKKSMDPRFSKMEFNYYDIKLLMHPVDFVVFDGLNDDNIQEIMFLSKTTSNPNLSALRKLVKKAIETENYSWQVARVDIGGKITYE